MGGGVGLVGHQRQTPPRQGILGIRSTRAGGQVQGGARDIGGRHPTPAGWFREAKGFNNGVFHLQRAGLGHRQQEQSGQPHFVVRGRGPDPGGLEFAFPSCFAHRDDRGQSVGPGDAINQDGGWRGGWVIGLDRQSGGRSSNHNGVRLKHGPSREQQASKR